MTKDGQVKQQSTGRSANKKLAKQSAGILDVPTYEMYQPVQYRVESIEYSDTERHDSFI
jgi:hypothetical protein